MLIPLYKATFGIWITKDKERNLQMYAIPAPSLLFHVAPSKNYC